MQVRRILLKLCPGLTYLYREARYFFASCSQLLPLIITGFAYHSRKMCESQGH